MNKRKIRAKQTLVDRLENKTKHYLNVQVMSLNKTGWFILFLESHN